MKRSIFFTLIIFAFCVGWTSAQRLNLPALADSGGSKIAAQVPLKLFDVRSGNGLVISSGADAGTYSRATYIAFKDNAAKDAIIEAFCVMGGYQATITNPAYDPNVEGSQPTIPNPQSKQAFYNQRLTQFIRDTYRSYRVSVAEKAAKATAEAAADAELPIK